MDDEINPNIKLSIPAVKGKVSSSIVGTNVPDSTIESQKIAVK